MKKRNLLIFLFVFTLCFSCLHGCSSNKGNSNTPDNASQSDTVISHGVFGDFEYDEYSDHVILTAYNADESRVSVPAMIVDKPVTGFGSVFARNFSISLISIPGSVQSIDERAFYMCDHLTTVTAADGLKSIGKEAFLGCSLLSAATIPASVTDIAEDAFKYCHLVVYGEPGSAIQEYAARFESIDFRAITSETTAAVNEESSMAVTEAQTDEDASQESTSAPTPEPPATQPPTEPPTEAPTEPPTEAPTEPPTEAPTEPPTEAPTEPPTPIEEPDTPEV